MSTHKLGACMCWIGCAYACITSLAIAGPKNSLPQWVDKTISTMRATHSPHEIEEAVYNGNRVFEFISGTRFDTGDEHVLFSDDHKQICVFGGFAGHVTMGSCNINKINYVR